MSRQRHQKKRNLKWKLSLSLLLIVILTLSGLYVEHARSVRIAENNAAIKAATLPKTTTDSPNKKTIEPKNAVSANFEQALVEKNFSGTVLIFKHGQIVLNKAYGWKDQAKNIKNTISTQYSIGSIQKSQTAYLIMQAVKSRKLFLDEKLSAFYPEIPNSENISIKDMLNMSSGLRIDEKKVEALNTTNQEEILAETVRQTTVAPNASYSYQPVNYVLMAGILEKIYETDYNSLFEKELKAPMDLKETSFYSKASKELAFPYSQSVTGPVITPTNPSSYADELGTGNIFMSASDLKQYFQNMFNNKFLTSQDREELLYTYPGEKYSSGLYNMGNYYHSRGVKYNYEAVADFSKDGQTGIILLSNVWTQKNGYSGLVDQFYKKVAASS